LYSPEYALEEINIHAREICSKANITSQQFKDIKLELAEYVHFIPFQEYASVITEIDGLITDSDDIDFLALAFKLNVPLWSNDFALKKQSIIIVLSTKELLNVYKLFD
jgi:predicted nucleic acid-binding protein